MSEPDRQPLSANGDLAVYVHWPFCLARCPYCDFNSHVRHGGVDEAGFLEAYHRELEYTADMRGAATVSSVFFGGGTPSLMSPATVTAILDAIARLWSLPDDAEITLEANPTSVEAEHFAGYRAAGVNRLSLGVQALNDRDLAKLGRMHSAAEAMAALDLAERHFARTSFDLIYARPGQDATSWERELGEALARATGHLSLYQLTIEPETPFATLHAAGRLEIPDPDEAAALFELTQALTADAGFDAYEVSNHARPGEASRHNLNYWRGGDYAGIGPGAHGRLTIGGDRHATAAIAAPEAWRDAAMARGHGHEQCQVLSAAEVAEEYLLMGLRLTEGIDLARHEALAPEPLDAGRLAALESEGLVIREAGRLGATPKGRLVLNALIAALAAG